jgi:hypothetical protein
VGQIADFTDQASRRLWANALDRGEQHAYIMPRKRLLDVGF